MFDLLALVVGCCVFSL